MAAIIWDMDGTLIDSENLWAETTYALSEAMGKRLTPEQRAKTVGTSFAFTSALCADNAGITLDEESSAMWKKRMYDHIRSLMETRLEVRSGVPELLDALHASGVPMAIATNTEREVAVSALKVLRTERFQEIVCGDDVPQPKPAPDMYLLAAEKLGVAPEDCLVFEDSLGGMTAALAAGCRVLGLPEDPALELPEGAVALRDVAGTIDFSGISAKQVIGWLHGPWPLP